MKCNTVLRSIRLVLEDYVKSHCPSGKKDHTEKYLKDLQDAEQIEEDTQIWKSVKGGSK